MSFQAMAAAVDVDLPGNKKCLLMMMANYADEHGFCYPSVSTLAQDAGVSERSVQNYLAEFAEKGIIEVHTRKTESGSTTSNLYRLMLHKAPQIVRTRKARNNRGANAAPYPANGDTGGCNDCVEGVQPFPNRGATVAPKPITEPTKEPITEPVDDAGASSSSEPIPDHPPVDPDEQAHHDAIFSYQDSAPLAPALSSQDGRLFSMSIDWQPTASGLSDHCQLLRVDLSAIDPDQQEEILGEFISHWISKPDERRTQARWERTLALQIQWVLEKQSREQSGASGKPDWHDDRWADGLNLEGI